MVHRNYKRYQLKDQQVVLYPVQVLTLTPYFCCLMVAYSICNYLKTSMAHNLNSLNQRYHKEVRLQVFACTKMRVDCSYEVLVKANDHHDDHEHTPQLVRQCSHPLVIALLKTKFLRRK